jgi:rubrerythrin
MTNQKLALFLAHSVELESEARERYTELAEAMHVHHNAAVAEFFERMAREAEHHLAEVATLAGDMELPQIKAWDFSWPEAEPPETVSYEAVHYRMSLRQAATLALANEQAAEHYYRQCAARSDDPEIRTIAGQFANEELYHAEQLQKLLKDLPDNGTFQREDDDPAHMPE